MRGVKFRGHNGSRWIYSECIYFNEFPTLNDRLIHMPNCNDENCDELDIETWDSVCYLSQYTGLKDKNGKEIFEGDILMDCGGKVYPIKWNEKEARFDTEDFYEPFQDIPYDIFSENAYSLMEVAGNVFEDKKLLIKEMEL